MVIASECVSPTVRTPGRKIISRTLPQFREFILLLIETATKSVQVQRNSQDSYALKPQLETRSQLLGYRVHLTGARDLVTNERQVSQKKGLKSHTLLHFFVRTPKSLQQLSAMARSHGKTKSNDKRQPPAKSPNKSKVVRSFQVALTEITASFASFCKPARKATVDAWCGLAPNELLHANARHLLQTLIPGMEFLERLRC